MTTSTAAATPRTPKHKKLYLINRDFQLRYTRIAVLVGLVSTLLTLFLILFPLFQFQIIRFPNFLPAPFLWAIAGAALLNFVILATLGILITHRIAGPMFALVRQFRMIQAGRFGNHLKIREGDDLKYVVRNYNEMVDSLVIMTQRDLTNFDMLIQGLEKKDPRALDELLTLTRRFRTEVSARLDKGETIP
jgi:hypothetical protein